MPKLLRCCVAPLASSVWLLLRNSDLPIRSLYLQRRPTPSPRKYDHSSSVCYIQRETNMFKGHVDVHCNKWLKEASLLKVTWEQARLVVLAAVLANYAESVVGALIQGRKSFSWVSNDLVNMAQIVLAAYLAMMFIDFWALWAALPFWCLIIDH